VQHPGGSLEALSPENAEKLWGGKMSSAFSSLRRYPLRFVMKTAQNRPSDDLASRWRAGPSRRPRGALKTECAMRRHTAEAP